jgi:DNA polymerase-3 subunit alpha
MLEVLAQAQGAGQKLQEDALSGQGSIFDLGDGAQADAAPRAMHAPVPADEFERPELLRLEKETLGIFLSSHPLADVRDALRARVDCPLSELGAKADGAWVTVGGLITEAKRIRTKTGDPMMFATLDDLDGQVELVIFNSAYASAESKAGVDKRVIVRGRVDHKDRGDTKLIVQEIEEFDPAPEEIAAAAVTTPTVTANGEPFLVSVNARHCPDSFIENLKEVLQHFPGDTDVLLKMDTSTGTRTLRFGASYRVSKSPQLEAEVSDLLGPDEMVA